MGSSPRSIASIRRSTVEERNASNEFDTHTEPRLEEEEEEEEGEEEEEEGDDEEEVSA